MGRWKTRREERRITVTLDPWSDLWPTCRSLRPRPPGEDAPSHDAQVGGRHASAGAAENIEGAPVITPQKFIAELRMLRTRAKELGLPITASRAAEKGDDLSPSHVGHPASSRAGRLVY